MKNLLLAIIMVCVAGVIVWLVWCEYASVAWFHERGSEGALSVLEETSNTLKRGGRRKRSYDASIDGVRVRVVTSEALTRGQQYPVLFSTEALRSHAADAGPFYAFKFGRKSDPTWDIFVRDYGMGYLWELAGLEALCIAGAWIFWRSFRRHEKA
jgi:hypothetical protein